jgi:hypothetical protein
MKIVTLLNNLLIAKAKAFSTNLVDRHRRALHRSHDAVEFDKEARELYRHQLPVLSAFFDILVFINTYRHSFIKFPPAAI